VNALLRFEGVTCVRSGQTLFERLDLAAGAGQALEIAGPNGAGKSSLLRVAAGLLRPAAGSVTRSPAVGLIDERLAFDPALSLADALRFWARIDRSHPDAIADALGAMGIARLATVPVRLLSTGQRKRAAFARLLASPADLWLLDEPLNGLDADGIARVTSEIRAHLGRGKAVVYASHQPIDTLFDRRQLVIGR
jgi:heme exporter protein A